MQQRVPKILYLVHRVPYPPNRGDRIRSFHLLEFLAARAEVHLAFLSEEPDPSDAIGALQEHCTRVEAVGLNRPMRWVRAAWSAARGRTATEGLFRSPRLAKTIRDWSEQTRFDAVVVFCSSMVQYLDAPGLEGVPTVVDLVDVDSQKWLDYAEKAGGLKRFLYRLEGRRLRRLEGSLADRVDAVTLVSPEEVEIYRTFRQTDRVHAIANGVDLDYFRPEEPGETDESQRLVFVGALDYRANIDGVEWFCRNVWPELHRRRPEATFTLVGSNPLPDARRLAELPGVELAADVPDVRPYLARAGVVVVPLRIARGIQNKVLEALAMGRPVVASPPSLEGLDVEPGVDLLQADEAGQWIENIEKLLDNRELRRRLGESGRTHVEQDRCWAARMKPFATLLGLADGGACEQHASKTITSGFPQRKLDSHA